MNKHKLFGLRPNRSCLRSQGLDTDITCCNLYVYMAFICAVADTFKCWEERVALVRIALTKKAPVVGIARILGLKAVPAQVYSLFPSVVGARYGYIRSPLLRLVPAT
eukprot:6305258-Pyramimonas_sp.AAC.1